MIGAMEWKNYILALTKKGMSQSQLAKEAGCGQATISDLASGKTLEPRHSLGTALLRIGARLDIQPGEFCQSSTQEASHG